MHDSLSLYQKRWKSQGDSFQLTRLMYRYREKSSTMCGAESALKRNYEPDYAA